MDLVDAIRGTSGYSPEFIILAVEVQYIPLGLTTFKNTNQRMGQHAIRSHQNGHQ